MGLETANVILELEPLNPLGSDQKLQGDDHIRMVKACLVAAYPIGSVLYNTSGTNPATYIGGTWAQISQGRAIVGVGDNGLGDAPWEVGDQRGSHDAPLTIEQLPVHSHDAGTLVADSVGSEHQHNIVYNKRQYSGDNSNSADLTGGGNNKGTDIDGAHSHTITGATAEVGAGDPVPTTQPSQAVYVWERTA